MILKIILMITKLEFILLLPLFYVCSPSSTSTKLQSLLILAVLASTFYFPTFSFIKSFVVDHPSKALLFTLAIGAPLKYIQRKLRYSRLNAIKKKYGYTANPASWEDMTVEQAQESMYILHSDVFPQAAMDYFNIEIFS